MRSSLFCDVTQRWLVVCYRRFGTLRNIPGYRRTRVPLDDRLESRGRILQLPKPKHSWTEYGPVECVHHKFHIFCCPSRKCCYLSGNKEVRAWDAEITTIKKLRSSLFVLSLKFSLHCAKAQEQVQFYFYCFPSMYKSSQFQYTFTSKLIFC